MWTPKRILLLGASFAFFFLGFLGYAFSSVGRIDGLPPLPAIYHPGTQAARPVASSDNSILKKRMEAAFGFNCPEQDRAIGLDIRSRGLLIAAENFNVMEDGRVSLWPISLAMMGKDPRSPDLSTIKGDMAYIAFDRPVRSFSEIGSRKIVAAEISGNIKIMNNRKRAERDQDIHISIPFGPLYFREDTHRIWTQDDLRVEDHKSKPNPHVVTAKGMIMELAVDPNPPSGKGKETVNGVKWLLLAGKVDMTLYTDGQQNFFDTAAGPGGKPLDPKTAENKRAVVQVTTPGPFRYDMSNNYDLATFDAGPATPETRGERRVRVVRTLIASPGNPGSRDELLCDKLVMRVQRRDSNKRSPSDPKPDQGEAVRVETVHATGPDGEVVLTSSAEKLVARGADFFHDALKGRTVLAGKSGAHIQREESEIQAVELVLQKRPPEARPAAVPGKEGYDVFAKGPGRLHFRDSKENRTLHAFWSNTLSLTRDKDEELVTLIGDARFLDESGGGQELKADELRVWLDPEQPAEIKTPGAPAAASETKTSGRKPRHLEARRNVRAKSREMNIIENNHLVVWFKDEEPPPPLADAMQPAEVPMLRPAPSAPAPAPAPALGMPVVGGATPGTPKVPAAPPRPFDIKSRTIQARIIRGATKNSVDELFCEGAVHVVQAPAKPEDKLTEVKGHTLKMSAAPDNCHVLEVTGGSDPKLLENDTAELHTDKMVIIGPQIIINQYRNMAWVVGDGAMTMESATNFQGDALKEPKPLNVLWKDGMVFNGSGAEFSGDIQATQDNARLTCQTMNVVFDRVVSLKHGGQAEPARVRYIDCRKEVKVEETIMSGKKLIKYQMLEGPGITMRALEADERLRPPGAEVMVPGARKATSANQVIATGPGAMRVIEAGGGNPLEFAPPGAPAQLPAVKPVQPGDPYKLTSVSYGKRMDANSDSGVVQFWENVRVLHVPVKDPQTKINIDTILATELPEGGMYLRSDRLKVMDRNSDGKPNKQMEATGAVRVYGRDFDATADIVQFNEAKDQIILEGSQGAATLRKFDVPGGKPQVVSGKRILYNRKTKDTKIEGTSTIHGSSGP
jgi:lipopolysaccharide export system protein LptA